MRGLLRLEPEDRRRDERGSAALEFIVVGVILLVPLAALVLTLGAVQDRLLGAESAARHTARLVSTASGPEEAERRARQAIETSMEEYGMDPAETDLVVRCIPTGLECPAAGATVVVTVSTGVELPFIPAVLGLDRIGTIPVQASAAYRVPRVGGGG
ncbi:Flp pilus assembly protein TadG [Microbacterium resistens]|uniref:Flp pilus assembly protein TadG n=1 Tax=Microbacterium resistens TaxID=156977 RepID=A0ABU1S759_9MICO|nr:TadE family protein [Microbacterium resistens]MDR6865456.1 Flp pilus assembly protein TadG [Microbacterium resistens]